MAATHDGVYRVRPWSSVRPNIWGIKCRANDVSIHTPIAMEIVFGGSAIVLVAYALIQFASGRGSITLSQLIGTVFGLAWVYVCGALLWRYKRGEVTVYDHQADRRKPRFGIILTAGDIEKVVLQLIRTEVGVIGPSAGSYRRSAWIWHTRIKTKGSSEILTIHCDKMPHRLKNEEALARHLAQRWQAQLEILR